jgi:chromosome partitioning protein
VTPLNDSFVDLDALAAIVPDTLQVTGVSRYSCLVDDARRARLARGLSDIDWIVLRNRLSMLASRNKRLVGEALQNLSERLGFRCLEGLAERVVFREFYLRGLTAFDDLNESTLGTRPTMSHVAAQLEVQHLLRAIVSSRDGAMSADMVGSTSEISKVRAA